MNYINNSILHNYMIDANYDVTGYIALDKKVNGIINKYINDFVYNLPPYSVEPNVIYYFNLNNEKYEYKKYLSYVYKIEEYTGGAHPSHYIFTVIYDKKNNKIISIIDFIKYDKMLLKKLSKLSRVELINNYDFDLPDDNLKSIFYDGTEGILKNYKNILPTESGLLIIFERYQIAPYYMGEFSIILPYDKLK
ncbi:MAG: DUF3298 domain-containing protein [Bacilli bacterium]|nr:DUF3298 domain-containing protein [Bacilli bacterium]